MALKKGEAHMAERISLDETGEYNIADIKKYLPEKKIVLINLVYRLQGLLVKKGNPKNIRGFGDLVRDDVAYINRQAGSGTDFCSTNISENWALIHSLSKDTNATNILTWLLLLPC